MRKFLIKTYGCQMNKSDSGRIASLLESSGLKETRKEKEADLVILNTCTVRQSAEDRIYGEIKNLKKLKSKPKIIITGCLAAKNPQKLKGKADLVFNIKDLAKLPEIIDLKKTSKNTLFISKASPFPKKEIEYYLDIPSKYSSNFHAYVPISNGCNNFCTYCVVPYARGREKSRSPEKILKEIKDLLAKKYKAITLVGQNVNSYGNDFKDKKIDFSDLLREIEKLEGDFWIWFVTSHPKDMSDKLIKTISQSKKICPYIHLPAQSGDNEILKRMNRNYTKEKYLSLIKKIRKYIPQASISTDIIVGFPGETEKQFKNTCQLFDQVKFDMAYIAQYSPREGTPAFKLKDDVSCYEKKRREKILTEILKKYALEKNKKLIGQMIEVLVEKKRNEYYFGKTKTFKTVKFKSQKPNLVGKIIKVKIKKAHDFGLEG